MLYHFRYIFNNIPAKIIKIIKIVSLSNVNIRLKMKCLIAHL